MNSISSREMELISILEESLGEILQNLSKMTLKKIISTRCSKINKIKIQIIMLKKQKI